MSRVTMVSLGPGDYELVTLKALKALQNCNAICVPTKSKDLSFTRSMTKKIVDKLFVEFNFEKKLVPVYAPMKFLERDWENQIDVIKGAMREYGNVTFVTLGDASVYSTVYYLLQRDAELYEKSSVIPGITSFSLASAKAKRAICLGDSGFSVVPLAGKIEEMSTVYMRPTKGMCMRDLQGQGDIFTFENLGNEKENIIKTKLEEVQNYMTLFIDFIKERR